MKDDGGRLNFVFILHPSYFILLKGGCLWQHRNSGRDWLHT
jgi:hypothetical protein